MIIEVDYENATISCRVCGHVNVFNRATDLPDVEFIAGAVLPCQNKECLQPVRIPIENANPAYELFIFEAYRCHAERRYMQSVSSLAQAFEMYFALATEVMLIYHPSHGMTTNDESTVTAMSERLFDATKEFSFRRMQNIFINLALLARPSSVEASLEIISKLREFSLDVPDSTIASATTVELKDLLLQLKRLPLGPLRNRVLHKRAYRPKQPEVEECLVPARDLLGNLWVALDLSKSLRGGAA